MTKLRTPQQTHFGRGLMLGAACMLFLSAPLRAETLALEFRPPEITPQKVCVPRSSEADLVAYWSDWNGEGFQDLSTARIKRDIKRLQQVDAKAWLETIELMIAQLAQRDPGYAGKNALLARIQALQAAGQFERIRNLQLVQELSQGAESASPRMQNALSRFYRDGVGVAKDEERADQLLISAGYGGNADALLTLSKLAQDGTPVEGWDIPTDLAVTMAFGGLVGELNATICDRTARIAREYHNGEIVQKNAALAHDWFRFTADLGDANAAWKVVEYHMRSEELDKDNAVLLQYLHIASDAGLPFAQIELGRLYESGSIVEKDLQKSLDLFRLAAKSGLRPGLTRLGLFLEEYAADFPGLTEEKNETFVQLAALDDAPGWVFSRLAQETQARKGRWNALPDAIKLFTEAANLGDMEGKNRLALSLLARGEEGDFDTATNLLSEVVSVHGGVTPSKQLYAAFMCQSADSPRIEEANYWNSIEAATDTANVDLSIVELITLANTLEPQTLAALQSQALYGRASSLASWLKFIEISEYGGQELSAFWKDYSNQFQFVLEALAKLELELAASREDRLAAFDLMRREFKKSGAPAAVSLAKALLDTASTANREEIVTLLEDAAAHGVGDAMQILAALNQGPAATHAIFMRYEQIIADNGDFDALVFALPFVDPAMREDYFARAVGLVQCDYQNAMSLAHVAYKVDLPQKAEQWVDIAYQLTRDNTWALVDLAKSQLDMFGPGAATDANELFAKAAETGDISANIGLFELAIDPSVATYAPAKAAVMLNTASEEADYKVLAAYLGRFRRADADTRALIQEDVDLPKIYHVAALQGDIYSMRNYGMYLRTTAPDADTLAQSTAWLKKAAEGGDVTAMAEYGQALAFGWGTTADLKGATQWLSMAEEQGSKSAAKIMALVRLSDTGDA